VHKLTTAHVDAQDAPSNDTFDSGQVNIWIVAADVEDGTDKNSRSIVLLVSHGDFDLLLTGDATFATENFIMKKYESWWLDVECLKLGHHGSKHTSTSPDWVNATLPEVAVASAALSPIHGHPNDALRARLEAKTDPAKAHPIRWWHNKDQGYTVADYKEAIYSTATNGTIVITSDGSSYDVTYTTQ
jgi:beta-lactamase superfamily II metal-dependent hydrolase